MPPMTGTNTSENEQVKRSHKNLISNPDTSLQDLTEQIGFQVKYDHANRRNYCHPFQPPHHASNVLKLIMHLGGRRMVNRRAFNAG
jgi:hypothetical protein